MSDLRAELTVAVEIEAYLLSAEYQSLAPSTQAEYRRVAEHLIAEIGAVKLVDCQRRWLRLLRDRWARGGHRYASMRLQVLKNALAPACDDERLSPHLFARLGKVAPKRDRVEANLAWQDDEVELVIQRAISTDQGGLARAVGLARWAGFRRGTICELTHDARVLVQTPKGQERRLRWETSKAGVWSDKPEDPRLTELLDDQTSDECEPFIAYNRDRRGWTPRQLSQALDRVVSNLTEECSVRRRLSFHGLRHARGVELAEANAADAVIMAQLEHKTSHSARVYRRQAERGRLADVGQRLVDEARGLARQSVVAEPAPGPSELSVQPDRG